MVSPSLIELIAVAPPVGAAAIVDAILGLFLLDLDLLQPQLSVHCTLVLLHRQHIMGRLLINICKSSQYSTAYH